MMVGKGKYHDSLKNIDGQVDFKWGGQASQNN